MIGASMICRSGKRIGAVALIAFAATGLGTAQSPAVPSLIVMAQPAVAYGPYNAHILQGGIELSKKLHEHEPIASAQHSWSMSLWFKSDEPAQTAFIAGVGHPWEAFPRYLALKDGRPAFWAGGTGEGHELIGATPLARGVWHSLAVSVDADGKSHLLADGAEVAAGTIALGVSSSTIVMSPTKGSLWPDTKHFGGLLAQVSLRSMPLSSDAVSAMSKVPAGLDNLPFEEGSRPWPVQSQGPSGMVAPQDPSLLPHSAAPFLAPKALPPVVGTDTATNDGNALILRHGWMLADAEDIKVSGSEIAGSSFNDAKWMPAVVPGTVLTTLIARGVYPDPDFGLDNMAIPESLSKHSFWYRNTFTPPATMKGKKLAMTFHGVNYRATIFINGNRVGDVLGAFRHKEFDVTQFVKPGEKNNLAVFIEPPFHPGIAHEQSLGAGSGDNGGVMMLDGPTFGATEGWDWIPGIRDRNIGIWQDVALTASGAIEVAVPQIITHLTDSNPAITNAEITVHVPLVNDTKSAVRGTVEIAFDDVQVSKAVIVPSGGTSVELSPKDFPQLVVQHPKLWWPNGYGAQDLHTMKLAFRQGGKASDIREERFGIREITYEISAFGSNGHVRRVEDSPTVATLLGKGPVIEQSHEGFRETPEGWITSIVPGMEDSPALEPDADTKLGTALVIKVNGVRIAVKGGSWGMDDMLKRVSRERIEPFFRLHKEANVNMIRNWMGQDTEDVFYELADEYGMLIRNDFWDSTQNWNLEPDDSELFLANAKDTISRYRNHPSIAVWCGRNEGVPPPAINVGLDKLITELDGTRYYSADSNKINLHDSGPYKYQEPEEYFTKLSLGFAVEVGLASPPTLEAFQAFLPKEDQWPISDDWAYHDWHQGGNGATEPFVQTINDEFGPATSLADFDRKAQMLNYEGHRAVFEGFNAHLWQPNSGRLLWMTQPAWPSTQWQIYSHDYDTHGSFYGVKKASEPIHVQMNLPAHDVAIINNTLVPLTNVTVTARVFDTMSKPLLAKTITLSAAANAETPALAMELQAALEAAGTVLVKLELKDSAGELLSDNFYWLAANKSDYRRMNKMPAATLTATAKISTATGSERHATITLVNSGTGAAVATKLTLKDAATGLRILPAYYSDNYVSLLPGATKTIDIAYPTISAATTMKVDLRGWNVTPASIALVP
ncbi:glycoside hydrolase family 2 protein [Tunturiibacter gelidoferens]|uniref:Exo-1,4-beta-D-glucosaminidase n=1 Tax=Tunturiibacter gelidiferens TaxID=3069689 RepID=A0A9X0QCS6_9BACT|nr:LamG-like jellyroll fold domain-containing protein [Edaphobacter lichenicola]MBB5327944.1 hypothetical protein [Edaphobacter lichenicola]